MDKFFTKALEEMDDVAKESFYKTIFMLDDSIYASKKRIEYDIQLCHNKSQIRPNSKSLLGYIFTVGFVKKEKKSAYQ